MTGSSEKVSGVPSAVLTDKCAGFTIYELLRKLMHQFVTADHIPGYFIEHDAVGSLGILQKIVDILSLLDLHSVIRGTCVAEFFESVACAEQSAESQVKLDWIRHLFTLLDPGVSEMPVDHSSLVHFQRRDARSNYRAAEATAQARSPSGVTKNLFPVMDLLLRPMLSGPNVDINVKVAEGTAQSIFDSFDEHWHQMKRQFGLTVSRRVIANAGGSMYSLCFHTVSGIFPIIPRINLHFKDPGFAQFDRRVGISRRQDACQLSVTPTMHIGHSAPPAFDQPDTLQFLDRPNLSISEIVYHFVRTLRFNTLHPPTNHAKEATDPNARWLKDGEMDRLICQVIAFSATDLKGDPQLLVPIAKDMLIALLFHPTQTLATLNCMQEKIGWWSHLQLSAESRTGTVVAIENLLAYKPLNYPQNESPESLVAKVDMVIDCLSKGSGNTRRSVCADQFNQWRQTEWFHDVLREVTDFETFTLGLVFRNVEARVQIVETLISRLMVLFDLMIPIEMTDEQA